MTTAAPRNEIPATLEELDERTQDAWAVYSDSLRDLTGRDYDEAETEAWDHLQRRLRELEGLRADAPRAAGLNSRCRIPSVRVRP